MVQHGKAMTQNIEIAKNHGPNCKWFGCCRRRSKWGFCQGCDKGKVAILYYREGDEDGENMTMVAPNGSVFGNPMP